MGSRLKKYKSKLDHKIIGGRYDATKDLAVKKQAKYFKDAVALENKVKAIVSGTPSIQHHFYIAFAEEMAKTPTSAERSIIFTKWAMRGLSWFYLLQVAMKIFGDVPELAGEGEIPPTSAYYSFHANAGPTAFDFSGNNNHGVIVNATWSAGKVGNCLSYNGATDYVQVAHHSSLEPSTITISLWIYPLSWNHTPHPALITKRTLDTNGYFFFMHSVTNTISIDWGGGAQRWDTGYLPPLNEWTHLAYTYDGTNGRFYVNGDLNNITALGLSANVPTGAILRIGADTTLIKYWFRGRIDEVIIYPRALTAEEIRTYYLATN